MDWFERLTGFAERDYDDTRNRLVVDGRNLRSCVNNRSYGIGELELVSLQSLRERAALGAGLPGRMVVRNVSGDVRLMHQSLEYTGALFQVASQFNLLEMASPYVTPEDGVTRYQFDHTQGPACAIAAGAGTIFRNYFATVEGGRGQTRERQLDGLADVGTALSHVLGRPVETLWKMRNGYALCNSTGLAAIGTYLRSASSAETDELRTHLRIGVHSDVEVTDGDMPHRQVVSQAFCSALPVAYSREPSADWQPFAQLVLEAAYEAALLAAVLNARRGASNIILMTRLGGGAFGNNALWIDAAMQVVLEKFRDFDLDVRLVSLGDPPPSMLALEANFR